MSYYKDNNYGRSERPRDDKYGSYGRSRDDYGSSSRSRDDHGNHGRSRDDYGSSSRSRDNDYGRQERSYGEEKYSSNSRREYGSYDAQSRGKGDSRDEGKDEKQLVYIFSDNILNEYLDHRVRLEVQARHKKTHVFIGTFMAFDLDMNVVLADSYRVHFRGGQEPTREEVPGLLVMRGSRVQNVRRERREQQLAEYRPPVPNSRKDKKKKARKPKTTEPDDAALPKSTPTRPVKLKRVWKEESGGQPSPSGAVTSQIRELKIKEEPADAEDTDLEAILKREPRDDLEDALTVKREPIYDLEGALAVKREPRYYLEDAVDDAGAKRFVKEEVSLQEFLNTSGKLEASDGEMSN